MIHPHPPATPGSSVIAPQTSPPEHQTQTPTETPPETAASLNQHDQAQTQSPAAHGSAANLVSFDTAATGTASSPSDTEGAMAQLQARFSAQGPEASADPEVQALLEAVRQQEDQHIKALLQMIQDSLDRAREMQEENKRHFYAQTLPQLQALEASLKQEQQQAEVSLNSTQQRQNQAAGALVQALQNQLSQAPQGPDPVADGLRARLNLIQQRLSLP